MEPNKNNWTLGELVTLSRQEKPLKNGGLSQYGCYIGSRYICIREETEGKRGILLKVLGKVFSDQVKIVDGKPFSKDEVAELFMGHSYFKLSISKCEGRERGARHPARQRGFASGI